MARAAYAQLGLEVVRLMPAGDPWQKHGTGVTAASHRWAMTGLLAEMDESLLADETELVRSGPSYTIDSISQLGERCVLILGADAALGISTWHRGDELVDLVDLAVAPRPGIKIEDVERAVGRPVTALDMSPMEISSTQIRGLAATGGDYRHLVPDSVYAYIETNRLYVSM